MKIALITLFPEMFDALTDYGISGRAVNQGLLDISSFNPRDFTDDPHATVDDRPYGGGPGMVLLIEPLRKAIKAAKEWIDGEPLVVYLSPQGKVLQQAAVNNLVTEQSIILIAGRYEGIDERLIQLEVDQEWSIGDYVLSGGEIPAMVLVDALIRQIPGALGHSESASQDSFAEGLLDCPHYTRPDNYQDLKVPDVLLSGNHEKIRQWRLKQSLLRTQQRRPDLLDRLALNTEQLALLKEMSDALADDGKG
ncbi:MAG: tRNA (guanosine(37)-N1)-methyltransferase TrmD [Porticoccaceae bacterium]|nr:tRNA (guanosine(37)-N1)-methyltransferase TrmD [Porticoccaceae bacterium]